MPPRAYDASKVTFYLDQSTVSDAFRAVTVPPRADAAYRPLLAWMERLAREANLCFSIAHIAEIARWADHGLADALAEWLDGITTVWVRPMLEVMTEEEDYWTAVAAGATPQTEVIPFALSPTGVFSRTSVADSIRAFREPGSISSPAGEELFEQEDNEVRTMLRAIQQNEAWVREQKWSAQKKSNERESARKADLFARARDAAIRRNAAPANAWIDPDGDIQGALVDLVDQDPRSLPSWRIRRDFNDKFDQVARARKPGSRGESKLISSFRDYWHLAVAAAYCDVFTCDQLVYDAIAPARTRLGKKATLAPSKHRGGPVGFVTGLVATWP
ncbi:hypothetical protein LZC95_49915 [Pendulispora brunnea]|uniref:Uncharacterized protein n=1 Tax=Pendulispora brunnea TaxID=2905690 RepID=A0ABZ2K759_9BACT